MRLAYGESKRTQWTERVNERNEGSERALRSERMSAEKQRNGPSGGKHAYERSNEHSGVGR